MKIYWDWYYTTLEHANKSNKITAWLVYFARMILSAQSYTQYRLEFLIIKTKLYDRVRDQLNVLQEKVLAACFGKVQRGSKVV